MNVISETDKSTRISALDGIRGLAILLVLLDHDVQADALSTHVTEWMKKAALGGWIGVDLFFVLSGFLITSILLRTKSRPSYFRNFYLRRLLRIWPLYLTACALILIVVPWLSTAMGHPDASLKAVASHQKWIWFHCVNFAMYLYPRDMINASVGVTHFWSLAVEEHFYLFWPLVVYFLPTRQIRRVCAALVVSALLVRSLGLIYGLHPYYLTLTPCRIDALAIGGWIATYSVEGQLEALLPLARWAGPVLATVMTIIFLVQRGLWPWNPVNKTFGLTFIAFGFGSLIVMALSPSWKWAGVFSSPFLQVCGRYSYGWYVFQGMLGNTIDRVLPWENLVLFFGNKELATITLFIAKVGVSFVAAVASWHFIESRFLRLKKRFELPGSTLSRGYRSVKNPLYLES